MVATEARLIGKSHFPSIAPRVTLSEILTGAYDGQWVEVEGVVRGVRKSRTNIHLDVALSDGEITADTVREKGADYDRLVDAKIRLRGATAPIFNHLGQMTGAYLVFPYLSQVKVEEPAPADPFTLPVVPVGDLLRFTPHSGVATPRAPSWDGYPAMAWPIALHSGRSSRSMCPDRPNYTVAHRRGSRCHRFSALWRI